MTVIVAHSGGFHVMSNTVFHLPFPFHWDISNCGKVPWGKRRIKALKVVTTLKCQYLMYTHAHTINKCMNIQPSFKFFPMRTSLV